MRAEEESLRLADAPRNADSLSFCRPSGKYSHPSAKEAACSPAPNHTPRTNPKN
jgi:hypothetical protein